jgi:hypothetical protein
MENGSSGKIAVADRLNKVCSRLSLLDSWFLYSDIETDVKDGASLILNDCIKEVQDIIGTNSGE